jgi:transcriptional regulator with XRE-family HTH domain
MTTRLGQKIRDRRNERKMSLDALATEAGLSKSYLWELENRESAKPSVEKLQALAKALDLDTAFLMDDAINEMQEDHIDRQFFRNFTQLDEADKDRLRMFVDSLRKKS